jgi:4'-phosphopantetheinyl transferase EntD
MKLTTLERDASAVLNIPLLLAYADSATPQVVLSRAEQLRLAQFDFENRRRDWLCGRNALKKLLSSLGRSDDTQSISFPHRHLSISHGDGVSFAVGTHAATHGLGIDYEPLRAIKERVASWFLDDREIDWLDQQPPGNRARHIIRLWTIKEAAFKSYPHNGGMSLGEFTVIDPTEQVMNVVATAAGTKIQVACKKIPGAYLSIATFQKT